MGRAMRATTTAMALLNRRTRPVPHPGSCGARHDPPCGDRALRPLLAAETLPSQDTLCHACGNRYRPHELDFAASGLACRAMRAAA